MTKRALAFFVFAAGLFMAAPALAQMAPDTSSDLGSQSLFGDKLTIKAGYKIWVAKWQAPLAISSGIQQVTADTPSVMSGPSFTGRLKLRDGPWFNSLFASFYWLNGGFDFQEARFSNTTTTLNSQSFSLRRDYAITGGLTIWEGFGVFAGYYDNRQRFTNITKPVAGGSFTTNPSNRSIKGPIFGIFGSTPVTERVSVYGNLAYAILEFESNTPAAFAGGLRTKSVHGYASELGVSIAGPRIWKMGTEMQLGFRYQEIQKTFGGSEGQIGSPGFASIANDITYGPTMTISAVF